MVRRRAEGLRVALGSDDSGTNRVRRRVAIFSWVVRAVTVCSAIRDHKSSIAADAMFARKEYWAMSILFRKTALLGFVAAMAFGGSAAIAGTIVVKASGPSAKAYTPGKALAAAAKLNLQAGDSVTVLSEAGTKVFKGPGVFALNSATAAKGNLASAVGNSGTKTTRTGAVRGGMSWTRPANVWMIDADKAGTVCFANGKPVSLWLGGIDAGQPVKLVRNADGKELPLNVRPGQRIATWPAAEMPASEGAQYTLSGGGLAAPVTFKFAAAGAETAESVGMASAFIAKGCSAQLDLLVKNMSVPEDLDQSDG
jgi:hypothetical protein